MPVTVTKARDKRDDALRRIASDVSGELDLDRLFQHVIDEAFSLFGVDRAGLWTYDGSPTPLHLAAQRGLSPEMLDIVERLPRDAPTVGMTAVRERRVTILDGDLAGTAPELARMYRAEGIRTMCYVPIVAGDDVLGLLVLYHRSDYRWSADETELARAFGDQIAVAMRNGRLAASTHSLAERLRAISELAGRLARQQDVASIARTVVREARRVVTHDSIRVYRVDHETGMCEPLAFQGRLLGTTRPAKARLRMPIGVGLTGWVAKHGRILRVPDAVKDPRSVILGDTTEPESMLVVPMLHQGVVHGVIVASRVGLDRFDDDDETTLSIFAGYAAQAMVNASNRAQLERQQLALEHQLASQRRLLQVNERLLSTLEPASVLDMIADSLKAIVPYDTLTIYRVDRERGVRRAVIARDAFAEEILAHESPLGVGLNGWVAEHGEAVCANEAHLDPRSVQIPGTPFEPEAMIVVPLIVGGETIGTLNVGRMGEGDAHFSPTEFDLTKLFAGQASIALQNAETHGEVQVRAEHDALTGLRNHGAFQRGLSVAVDRGADDPFAVLMMDLDAFKAYNDSHGHPAGDALLARIATAMRAAVRDTDHVFRYGGDEFSAILPGADRVVAHDVADRIRHAVVDVSRLDPDAHVTISVGVACFPDDGVTKDELVSVADRAMYLAKPSTRASRDATSDADPYLRALDETALALLDQRDPSTLLETILVRACALLGTPNGYIYLAEPDRRELVVRYGMGYFEPFIGERLSVEGGLAGQVFQTGQAVAVESYDELATRAGFVPRGELGAVVGVPLNADGQVVGVIGLAVRVGGRTFRPREIEALGRFAQLASIALDNARLIDVAHHGALYDLVTGLPNRELLTDRLAHALTSVRPDDRDPIAVILLDLDRFKVINESVGHAVGDRLLMAVGQRLVASVRPGDTVARFGGDEFGILLDGVIDHHEARRVADRLVADLRTPFPLGGREWFMSASMGIALSDPGRSTPDDLLREAEIAMVRAKSDPMTRHAMFEPSMSAETLDRVDLENDLRKALERGQLRLEYQPLVDLVSERIVGFEALVRWQHPVRGLIPPLSFIPLAEETGLIVPIGRWILETACGQAAAWRDERPDGPPLVMSVNLSARQFMQDDLVDEIATILADAKLDARGLELEITETILMDQTDAGVRMLRRLRDLGVRLVLDDFGTGYSSLSYLKHLPLDTIKIDRSFVSGLDGAADRSIVQAVVALAHGLRIGVVAEGIETITQQRQLVDLGCTLGQGYLFSRPVPADEATRLFTPRRPVARPTGRPVRAMAGSGSPSSGSRRRGGGGTGRG